MSTSQLSAARTIWRVRRERTGGYTAYALYALVLVAVIVIVPLVRALWVVGGSPSGLAVLTSAVASAAVSMLVVALWACGLLVGRMHGPAFLPPFLLHALMNSGIRRFLALRRPVLRSGAIIVAAYAAGAVFVGVVLFNQGQAQFWGVVAFVATSIATGVVTTALWLIGQVFPRAAFPIVLTMLTLAGTSLLVPEMLVFTPWGWVGATYPSAGSGLLSLAGMTVLAAASIGMIPVLLDRLTGMQLGAQAAQWERATAFSFSFDFRAAASVYEAGPRLGRSIRAITPSRHRWVTFFVRDLVGQARTPGRSLGAIIAAAAAGVLMTLSFLPCAPAVILAGTAGIVLYQASGPITKGLQHAASVAGDYPLYGISDRRLMLLHTLFPSTALLAVLLTATTVTTLVSGAPFGHAILGAFTLGVLSVALRVSSALKGPLPPILLTPVNTPAGDLSIVTRVGWAFSDPLIAIVATITVTFLPMTPIPLALLVIWTTALMVVRWKKRR